MLCVSYHEQLFGPSNARFDFIGVNNNHADNNLTGFLVHCRQLTSKYVHMHWHTHIRMHTFTYTQTHNSTNAEFVAFPQWQKPSMQWWWWWCWCCWWCCCCCCCWWWWWWWFSGSSIWVYTIHSVMYVPTYSEHTITKTRLYNIDPLKTHFYTVKLGFTGVYIIFLISAKKHRLWVLVRTASPRQYNEYPQSMFLAEILKISELFLSENFQLLEVKFSISLNRRVYVMLCRFTLSVRTL